MEENEIHSDWKDICHSALHLPARVSEVVPGIGSFLTIYLDVEKEYNGQKLFFWIYLCDWVVSHSGKEIFESTSIDEAGVEVLVRSLTNLKLLTLRCKLDFSEIKLELSEGWCLHLDEATDIYEENSQMIIAFHGDSPVFSVAYPRGLSGGTVEGNPWLRDVG